MKNELIIETGLLSTGRNARGGHLRAMYPMYIHASYEWKYHSESH